MDGSFTFAMQAIFLDIAIDKAVAPDQRALLQALHTVVAVWRVVTFALPSGAGRQLPITGSNSNSVTRVIGSATRFMLNRYSLQAKGTADLGRCGFGVTNAEEPA
jgi:hypothetical protein